MYLIQRAFRHLQFRVNGRKWSVATFVLLLMLLPPLAFGQTTQQSVKFAPSVDATTQIQSSINNLANGGIISLQPATYQLRTALTITHNGITIAGHGAKLLMSPTSPKLGPGSMIWLQGANNVTIKDVVFDANAIARGSFEGSTHTILLNWSNNVTIQNCQFSNSLADDVFMWGGLGSPNPPCQQIHITKCKFDGALRNSISIVNAQYVLIDNNSFSNVTANAPSSAVDIEPNYGDPVGCTHHVIIETNTVTNCTNGLLAWNIAAPFGLVILHNTLAGGTIGIETQLPGTIIAYNTITGTKSFPVCTTGGSAIFGNTIAGCPKLFSDSMDVVGPGN